MGGLKAFKALPSFIIDPLPDKDDLVALVRSEPEQSVGLFREFLALLAASETEIRSLKPPVSG